MDNLNVCFNDDEYRFFDIVSNVKTLDEANILTNLTFGMNVDDMTKNLSIKNNVRIEDTTNFSLKDYYDKIGEIIMIKMDEDF